MSNAKLILLLNKRLWKVHIHMQELLILQYLAIASIYARGSQQNVKLISADNKKVNKFN